MFEGIKKKLSDAIKQAVKREKEEAQEAPPEPEQAQESIQVPEKETELESAQEAVQEEAQEEAQTETEPQSPSATVESGAYKAEEVQQPIITEGANKPGEEGEAPAHKDTKEREEHQDVKISKITKLKGVFSGTVRLSDSDIDRFSDAMMTSLLQSDVSFSTATAFTDDLKEKLKERIPSKNIESELIRKVRASLMDVLSSAGEGVDIFAFINGKISAGEKPVKILFLGPNGTGKTTTIGKVAYALKKKGVSVVLSASDTFRAAAIEQTEYHAAKIGVPVIKSKYGADPASVAYDAINYAGAHDIGVVLIDSAGRQETNKNLLAEISKMVRVAKPDLTIYVGESTSGNAIENQVLEFTKNVKIDGIILTKMDCDAKGGAAISIAHTTGVPVIYLGTGEAYDALVRYTPQYVVDSVLPE